MSITSLHEFYPNCRRDKADFGHCGFPQRVIHYVFEEIWVFPSGAMSQTLDFRENSQRHVDRCRLCSNDHRNQFITLSVHICIKICIKIVFV